MRDLWNGWDSRKTWRSPSGEGWEFSKISQWMAAKIWMTARRDPCVGRGVVLVSLVCWCPRWPARASEVIHPGQPITFLQWQKQASGLRIPYLRQQLYTQSRSCRAEFLARKSLAERSVAQPARPACLPACTAQLLANFHKTPLVVSCKLIKGNCFARVALDQ